MNSGQVGHTSRACEYKHAQWTRMRVANAFDHNTNKHKSMLTTNFDVAVLPGCVWVRRKAPGSVAPVWVPTVVVVQAFVRKPNTKHRAVQQPQCIDKSTYTFEGPIAQLSNLEVSKSGRKTLIVTSFSKPGGRTGF